MLKLNGCLFSCLFQMCLFLYTKDLRLKVYTLQGAGTWFTSCQSCIIYKHAGRVGRKQIMADCVPQRNELSFSHHNAQSRSRQNTILIRQKVLEQCSKIHGFEKLVGCFKTVYVLCFSWFY